MVGGGGVHDGQLPTFDAESKSAKIPKSLYSGRGDAWWPTSNFWCWVEICWNPKIPLRWGGGGDVKIKLPIFDAESKSAKI